MSSIFFGLFLHLSSSPHFSCSTFNSLLFTYRPSFLSLSALLLLFFTFSVPLATSPQFRDKFVEVDLKPVCKHCYERLPDDMKRRLAKREHDLKDKKKKLLIPMCLWSFLPPFSSPVLYSRWSVSLHFPFCIYFVVSLLSYLKQHICPQLYLEHWTALRLVVK